MRETHVPSLGWIDPLEKGMATHSSILPWRSPWMEEPDGLKSMGLQRVGHHGVIRNKCKKSKLYGTRPRVQFLSGIQLFETPWTAVYKDFLSITNSQRLLKPMSIALVMPSNHLILCPPFLSSICHSIRVFFFISESVLHIRWPKYWSWSFSISPSNKYSRFISFRIDWSDLLAVQGTLRSVLKHHSSKAWVLWHSATFMVPILTSMHAYWKNNSID